MAHVGEELRLVLACFRDLAALVLDIVEQPHVAPALMYRRIDAAQSQRAENQREYHHQRKRNSDSGKGTYGAEQRDDIEPDQAPFFLFVIDDVERIEDGLHASIGAPQRNGETQQKAERELSIALCGYPGDLGSQQVERLGGNNRCGSEARSDCTTSNVPANK
jgi:hypothetical protein